MKTKHLGAFVRVSLSAREVETFNHSWPCSPIPSRAAWFEYQVKNADLVGMSPHLSACDGDALKALSDDAQKQVNKPDFPSLRDLTHALREQQKYLRRICSKDDVSDPHDTDATPGTDIRLQCLPSGWRLWSGDSSYDTDHRGAWGAGFLPYGRTNLRELARDLLNEARDSETL